jgi:hypothetical protein
MDVAERENELDNTIRRVVQWIGSSMRTSTWFGLVLATAVGLGGLISQLPKQFVHAQPLQSVGYFLHPPRLVGAETTYKRTVDPNATYYFTLEVPEDAGSALQRIMIVQRDGSSSIRLIQFEPENSRAFVGTPRKREADLALGAVTFDRDQQTVAVTFDPPVPPGTTVTVGLRPERNPRLPGVYLFGVTAFPTSDTVQGQFLGYGRLTFYGGNQSVPFF